jgi:hypothetical protein
LEPSLLCADPLGKVFFLSQDNFWKKL